MALKYRNRRSDSEDEDDLFEDREMEETNNNNSDSDSDSCDFYDSDSDEDTNRETVTDHDFDLELFKSSEAQLFEEVTKPGIKKKPKLITISLEFPTRVKENGSTRVDRSKKQTFVRGEGATVALFKQIRTRFSVGGTIVTEECFYIQGDKRDEIVDLLISNGISRTEIQTDIIELDLDLADL
jgi:translation initiation factor 1 (eIF-1/SUI1)